MTKFIAFAAVIAAVLLGCFAGYVASCGDMFGTVATLALVIIPFCVAVGSILNSSKKVEVY